MIQLLIILFTLCGKVLLFSDEEAAEYLSKYGYLNVTSLSITDLENSITIFQEYFDLPVDGSLNKDAIELMQKPRCELPDHPISSYETTAIKWSKNHLSWYFALGTAEDQEVARKVFNVWANVTNLNFLSDVKNPDIVIQYSKTNHSNHKNCMLGKCGFNLDRGTIGHAYFPKQDQTCVEVHLSQDKNWYKGFDDQVPSGKISLFLTLLHEIGHSLGLSHSKNWDSIMHPIYSEERSTLTPDDVLGIQSLYGEKILTSVTTPIISTRVATSSSDAPELCKIRPTKMLLLPNQHLYVLYGQWFWILPLNNQTSTYFKAEKLSKRLYSIDADHIDHAFMKVDGNIVVITKNRIYELSFPDFRYVNSYNLTNFAVEREGEILCLFNTYVGKTFLFRKNGYYSEIDECNMNTRRVGLIFEKFPGVPLQPDGAFRYTDGNLYFFKANRYYKFNEFKNMVVHTEEFNTLSIFGVNCVDKQTIYRNILKNLAKLLAL